MRAPVLIFTLFSLVTLFSLALTAAPAPSLAAGAKLVQFPVPYVFTSLHSVQTIERPLVTLGGRTYSFGFAQTLGRFSDDRFQFCFDASKTDADGNLVVKYDRACPVCGQTTLLVQNPSVPGVELGIPLQASCKSDLLLLATDSASTGFDHGPLEQTYPPLQYVDALAKDGLSARIVDLHNSYQTTVSTQEPANFAAAVVDRALVQKETQLAQPRYVLLFAPTRGPNAIPLQYYPDVGLEGGRNAYSSSSDGRIQDDSLYLPRGVTAITSRVPFDLSSGEGRAFLRDAAETRSVSNPLIVADPCGGPTQNPSEAKQETCILKNFSDWVPLVVYSQSLSDCYAQLPRRCVEMPPYCSQAAGALAGFGACPARDDFRAILGSNNFHLVSSHGTGFSFVAVTSQRKAYDYYPQDVLGAPAVTYARACYSAALDENMVGKELSDQKTLLSTQSLPAYALSNGGTAYVGFTRSVLTTYSNLVTLVFLNQTSETPRVGDAFAVARAELSEGLKTQLASSQDFSVAEKHAWSSFLRVSSHMYALVGDPTLRLELPVGVDQRVNQIVKQLS